MSRKTPLTAGPHARPFDLVIAADGQTRTHKRHGDRIMARVPAGGVSVALDRVSQQTHATFVSRARTAEDMEVLDARRKVNIRGRAGTYQLKRIVLSDEELHAYYYGYSNQSLWPLFHSAVERVVVAQEWYRGYVDVNRRFAEAIQPEVRGRSLVWVNDYQLTLVPSLLTCGPDVTVAAFWHIPWPGPDILRRLPERETILRAFLSCDLVGFHTEEYARNFLQALESEVGAEIDDERRTATVGQDTVRTVALPMGVDVEAIRDVTRQSTAAGRSAHMVESDSELSEVLQKHAVMLGVDRLDYSKGIPQRLIAIDRLFERYPEYRGKAVYVGIMSPTREVIPAYQQIKQEVLELEARINAKYADESWKPLHLRYEGLSRADVLRLYTQAAVCLVTPVADGMNLVAKEFVVAASGVRNPGMLVLSEFAGASNELSAAIVLNPHDIDAMAEGIYAALRMPTTEKRSRMRRMARDLEREDVYSWAQAFINEAMGAGSIRDSRVA